MVLLSYCLVTLLVFETIQGQANSDGQVNVTTTSAITTSNEVSVSRNGNVESQVTSQETETTSHEEDAEDLDARLERFVSLFIYYIFCLVSLAEFGTTFCSH